MLAALVGRPAQVVAPPLGLAVILSLPPQGVAQAVLPAWPAPAWAAQAAVARAVVGA